HWRHVETGACENAAIRNAELPCYTRSQCIRFGFISRAYEEEFYRWDCLADDARGLQQLKNTFISNQAAYESHYRRANRYAKLAALPFERLLVEPRPIEKPHIYAVAQVLDLVGGADTLANRS